MGVEWGRNMMQCHSRRALHWCAEGGEDGKEVKQQKTHVNAKTSLHQTLPSFCSRNHYTSWNFRLSKFAPIPDSPGNGYKNASDCKARSLILICPMQADLWSKPEGAGWLHQTHVLKQHLPVCKKRQSFSEPWFSKPFFCFRIEHSVLKGCIY